MLTEAGKRTTLDGGHKFTPGQKFAHWEHRGVKLRVEVGPREAEKGCCTLARTFEPGSVARRETGVEVQKTGKKNTRKREKNARKKNRKKTKETRGGRRESRYKNTQSKIKKACDDSRKGGNRCDI